MKAILIEQNAFQEMQKNIQDVKLELLIMKKELQNELDDILTVEQVKTKTVIFDNIQF